MQEPAEVTFYNVPAFLNEKPIEATRARAMIIWQGFDVQLNSS